LATKTGQKLGRTKIVTALRASAERARMITPGLARVSSIAAPIHGYETGSGLAPMLLRNEKDIEIRPEGAARISQQGN
jgi:hypothetical protein